LLANSRYLPPPYSFYGGGYQSRHIWGLTGVRFLFYSFYLNVYDNIYMFTFKKKPYFGTTPARSETGFGILTFINFKKSSKTHPC
jgi:hypothetical protein